MECPNLCSFLYCQLKTMKLFNKCVICIFSFLKSILKSTSIQWFLLIWNICYNKKSLLCQLVVLNIYRKQSLRVVLWNHFKSGNIETLYLLSALKEPVQINYKKIMLCYGTSMDINILLTYLLKISLTRFMALVLIYTPWNISENQSFPDVSRGHRKTSRTMKCFKSHWIIESSVFSYKRRGLWIVWCEFSSVRTP